MRVVQLLQCIQPLVIKLPGQPKEHRTIKGVKHEHILCYRKSMMIQSNIDVLERKQVRKVEL